MTGIDFIEEMIDKAKQYEANGEYLKAYRQYYDAECVAENDIDAIMDSGFMSPKEYMDAQAYARHRRNKVWYRLSEDEKRVANSNNIIL